MRALLFLLFVKFVARTQRISFTLPDTVRSFSRLHASSPGPSECSAVRRPIGRTRGWCDREGGHGLVDRAQQGTQASREQSS